MTATIARPRIDWLARLRSIMVLRPGQRVAHVPGIGVRASRRAVSSAAPSTILVDLVSYWPLDESSAIRSDVAGSSHMTGDATVTPDGKIGPAAVFSNTSISVADNAALSTGNIDFTLAAWVKITTDATGHIAGKWGAAGGREYVIYYDSASKRFQFYVSNDGTAAAAATATNLGTPTVGTWYYVVCWHDSTANTINIQINNGTANSAAHATGVYDGAEPFRIGSRSNPITGFFLGHVDELAFWKRTLSSDERTELYNSGSGLAWPFSGRSRFEAVIERTQPVTIWLAADLGTDCDDTGDHAALHYLVSEGEATYIAGSSERTMQYSVSAIDAINTYYGAGSTPIGANKGSAFLTGDLFAEYLTNNFTNDLTFAAAPEAVALFRQTLAAQSSKITIVTTGPVRLLHQLMLSGADGYSALTGLELIAAKVSEIVMVGGTWTRSTTAEFNIVSDAVAASYVLDNCPVMLTICGIEMGATVITGSGLTANTPVTNPVRAAYEIHRGENTGQSAWAIMGLLYAVRGTQYGAIRYFYSQRGTGAADSVTGHTTWTPSQTGTHRLLYKAQTDAFYVDIIDPMLEYIP